jgi:hypothetical protein
LNHQKNLKEESSSFGTERLDELTLIKTKIESVDELRKRKTWSYLSDIYNPNHLKTGGGGGKEDIRREKKGGERKSLSLCLNLFDNWPSHYDCSMLLYND